jgi:predicted nucleotidyltransferase
MIAFDDRPDQRIKDIKDINSILTFYPQLESEMIWGDHFDLYEDDRRHDEVSMIVLGRQIKKIVAANLSLRDRIIRIIDKAINQESHFLSHMIETADDETLQSKAQLLINLKKGIIA